MGISLGFFHSDWFGSGQISSPLFFRWFPNSKYKPIIYTPSIHIWSIVFKESWNIPHNFMHDYSEAKSTFFGMSYCWEGFFFFKLQLKYHWMSNRSIKYLLNFVEVFKTSENALRLFNVNIYIEDNFEQHLVCTCILVH